MSRPTTRLRQIVNWCIQHRADIPRRIFRRRTDSLGSTASAGGISRCSECFEPEVTPGPTLVDQRHHELAFSNPEISHTQNVYSYFPWSESEHEAILSRSPPPPMRRHYNTFPSLVEMGGFLAL